MTLKELRQPAAKRTLHLQTTAQLHLMEMSIVRAKLFSISSYLNDVPCWSADPNCKYHQTVLRAREDGVRCTPNMAGYIRRLSLCCLGPIRNRKKKNPVGPLICIYSTVSKVSFRRKIA